MKDNSYPAIETERLLLREVRSSDALAMFHMIYHNPNVLKTFLAQYMEHESEAHVNNLLTYQENGHLIYMIELKNSGDVIGMLLEQNDVDGCMELGYAIGEPYWNQGYTTEAMRAVIQYLFDHDYHQITAECFIENVASARVMEKSGMIKTDKTYLLNYLGTDHQVIEYVIKRTQENH